MPIGRLIGFVAALLLGLVALGQPVLADVVVPADTCCLVAPNGLADDGARFVVDSTGSTVLRAQGPQGWINVSEHAAQRMTQRGISIDAVDNALTTQPFDYFHAGVTKTGYYDAANNLFVGSVDDVITTVFHPSAGQGYIDNLLAAGP